MKVGEMLHPPEGVRRIHPRLQNRAGVLQLERPEGERFP